ncbi:hypothetical protein [Rhodococcus sp. IEGM 1318]|uniref:hypothetical protein n=1 Tax=Rhodococcus sp. IEGM 1318 TaxID=3082226 RepID=UPI002953A83E|nr:hypothetical protein [Rhodococcus sp. IEGM 1318]MDV8006944.1 hypothetical protein [Rhodococcus sp. IEGM 1318]
MIASAAHELLRLRSNTPTLPIDDCTDQLARAQAESDRRHVVAAQAEAALVDRIAALRAYEEAALTPIGAALNNLQAVTELAAGGGDVDRVFRQITGSEYATGHTTAMRDGIDDVRAGLDAPGHLPRQSHRPAPQRLNTRPSGQRTNGLLRHHFVMPCPLRESGCVSQWSGGGSGEDRRVLSRARYWQTAG